MVAGHFDSEEGSNIPVVNVGKVSITINPLNEKQWDSFKGDLDSFKVNF